MEMVGDYTTESFDSGPGANVRDNAVAACAILHARLGLDPHTLRLHKEDKRTDHDCPGKHVDKADFIRRVVEYMGEGGEHARPVPAPAPQIVARTGVVKIAGLNLRAASSASSGIVASLGDGTKLSVQGSAMNGTTEWLRVDVAAIGKSGWVAAKYVTL
jgi:SH3 domain-containing protein